MLQRCGTVERAVANSARPDRELIARTAHKATVCNANLGFRV